MYDIHVIAAEMAKLLPLCYKFMLSALSKYISIYVLVFGKFTLNTVCNTVSIILNLCTCTVTSTQEF